MSTLFSEKYIRLEATILRVVREYQNLSLMTGAPEVGCTISN
jgi:hypothetical protein